MEGSVAERGRLPHDTQIIIPTFESNRCTEKTPRQRVDPSSPLHQLIVVVRRKKWFVVAFALIGGILAGLAGLARPLLYEATTQIIIDAPTKSSPVESAQDLLDSSIDDNLTMLSSQAQLRRVLAELRKMPAAIAAPSIPANGTGTNSVMKELVNRLWPHDLTTAQDPDTAELKILRNGLRVGQELRSRVITVGFTDTDPARAALIANTMVQVYVSDLIQKHRTSDQQELDSTIASLPRVQGDLVDATNRLETYRLIHGAVDQSAENNAANEMAELNRQISLSKADLTAKESQLDRIQNLRSTHAPVSAVADEIGSPLLSDLIARQAGTAAGKDLNAAIDREIQEDIAALAAQTNIYHGQIAALEARKKVLDEVVADTADRLSGMHALEPKVAILTQRYNELLSRQQDLMRRIANPSPGLTLLSTAWPPSTPRTISPVFLVPPGMIVFAIIAAAIVMIRSRFNKTLRSEAETEAVLGIPCVGLLPKVPKLSARHLHHLVLDRQNSQFGRAVTRLFAAAAPTHAKGRPTHILLVSSSLRDDGKTELAWGLALAATRLGGKVLFLDLDREGTQLTEKFCNEFGMAAARPSFVDYFCDRCALHEAVVRMPEIGIDLMAAPAPDSDLLALLSSGNTSRVTQELRSKYCFVVVNAPSGLEGPEIGYLTHWADAVLFAVRWAKTRRSVARSVLDLLQRSGAAPVPVGSVLTEVNLKAYARYGFEDSADLLLERAR